MHTQTTVERLVDLIDPSANVLLNMTNEEAAAAVAAGDSDRVSKIDGQFAIIQKQGNIVRLARSIGRPMRYFLAKQTAGPCLIVAERMEEIRAQLERDGLGDQFHPSYTRMVPAHYLVEILLVGCPDPNPTYTRYFTPVRNSLSSNLDEIGRTYIGALADECHKWLDRIDDHEPIGVLFSGGIDSGAVFLLLYHLLLQRGESPARLKAFTLSVEGGDDAKQAKHFLESLDLSMFLEVVDVRRDQVDFRDAIRVIEDYKPLDVQSATMALALCQGIRGRYADWKYLVDGDGGDENLKDYPIEENSELTIRSVLNNLMLYQEGWGVNAIKHSLVFSGGQSRGHVRSYAPARVLGFQGFSPYALPNVIGVAESIPFIELTDWDHARLYALKGEVTRRGVEAITGIEMPVYEKRRFQRGAVDDFDFQSLFPSDENAYRDAFIAVFG
ncbi:MAG: asparagine synthetase B family protein [Planctomycetaceae bacterium]|nr:asparagine synthetase B family protein [Planctomycetales bacterium]MCB9926752.1 asparagine synthetase B family protein [Planctomycetaceae bacterium]